ncbi:hypothetical protein BKM04_21515 [Pseudomonas syringae pv. syringae]|nr:hypothetical protein BKM04_21515 [Pseudomonas syringae pv. syringae]POD57914.1 hypothetical protein BKM06_23195 [Pseudomonas syringae pv. syringae]
MLRVGMPFVTLRVTQWFCDVRWDWGSTQVTFSPLTIVPMLRVGMPFVTLRVTQRFCDFRWIRVRLRSPFRL